MNKRSTKLRPGVGLILAALLAVTLTAYAAQRMNGLQIGPNPTTTNFEVVSGGDAIWKEKADHSSTPSAGYGYLWVKNTVPSTLIFTDDTGGDTTLGAGGGAVDSVNGQTGAVDLDADDIDDAATTNRFVTAGDQTNLANLSGTNTGDATLSGTPDYITRSGQVFTLGLIDLTADVTGTLPDANVSDTLTASKVVGSGSTTDAVDAATAEFAGNIPVARHNSGTGADATTFWRGDGAWALPPVTLANAVELTNKRITKRSGSTTSSTTPTINTDTYDAYAITALAGDITSFTTNLSGTPQNWDQLRLRITGTAARAITWGASFADGAAALPLTTVTTKTLHVLLEWDGSIWRCMAAGSNP